MRNNARPVTRGALAISVERDAVQLHAMIDEAEAQTLGNPLLQFLELIVGELDDVARFDVDQMIVMSLGRGLVTRSPVTELVPFEDSRLLEQPDRAVDGGNRDVRVDRGRPRVQGLDVGMVLAVAEHARDHLALLGNPEPLVGAERLNIDRTRHGPKLGSRARVVQRR